MEFTNNPRNPNPRPSTGATPQRSMERRVFNDFAPRPVRPMQYPGAHPIPKPHAPQHAPTPPTMQQRPPMPASQPARPVDPAPMPTHASALRPAELPRIPLSDSDHDEKMHKPNHHNTHAGLVGFICFVLLAGLLLSPLLPGKILNNFPGSSQTESTGEQALACATELGSIDTNSAYTLKLGSPIVYKYTLITTQKAQCGDKLQSADIGRSSQFNPLGLFANLLLAVAVSVIIAKLWRFIASRTKN